jgi:hypothetical protein
VCATTTPESVRAADVDVASLIESPSSLMTVRRTHLRDRSQRGERPGHSSGQQTSFGTLTASACVSPTFGSLGIDDDGAYFLTDFAGVAGSPIQFDTDGVPYIPSGA